MKLYGFFCLRVQAQCICPIYCACIRIDMHIHFRSIRQYNAGMIKVHSLLGNTVEINNELGIGSIPSASICLNRQFQSIIRIGFFWQRNVFIKPGMLIQRSAPYIIFPKHVRIAFIQPGALVSNFIFRFLVQKICNHRSVYNDLAFNMQQHRSYPLIQSLFVH